MVSARPCPGFATGWRSNGLHLVLDIFSLYSDKWLAISSNWFGNDPPTHEDPKNAKPSTMTTSTDGTRPKRHFFQQAHRRSQEKCERTHAECQRNPHLPAKVESSES